jgi:hypothetical protein
MKGKLISETEELKIFNYWIQTGSTQKEIAHKFSSVFSHEKSVSHFLSRMLEKRKYQKIFNNKNK